MDNYRADMDFLRTFMQTPAPSSSSLFLAILPLEIRLEVYRYLVGRYTKLEHEMRTDEYNECRTSILEGPDHSYDFHPAILGASQQVRNEAMDLLMRENTLVSLTCTIEAAPLDCWARPRTWRGHGVAVFAVFDTAPPPPYIGMNIGLDTGLEEHKLITVLFAANDLPAACVSLQQMINESIQEARQSRLTVEISPEIEKDTYHRDGAWPVPGSPYSKCLEPLRQLRRARMATVSEKRQAYFKALLAVDDPQLIVQERMDLVTTHFEQANVHILAGAYKSAISESKAALRTINSGPFEDLDVAELMLGGFFEHASAQRARHDITVQLHAMIAHAFLKLGKLRLARIYVERIYSPLASYSRYSERIPLNIEPGVHTHYAKIFFVAAEISNANGDEPSAKAELTYASSLDPENLEISQRLEERMKFWTQRRKQAEQVVRLRCAKGDKAVLEHNLPLAQEKYEAAYEKILGSHAIGGDLYARTVSKLINVALELHDDKTVLRWANLSINQNCEFGCGRRDLRYNPWTMDGNLEDIRGYRNEAEYIAHYGKAVTFQKQGKVTAAIEEFEYALQCIKVCYATYYQLQFLKQRETEEDRIKHEIDRQFEMRNREAEGEEAEGEEAEGEEA